MRFFQVLLSLPSVSARLEWKQVQVQVQESVMRDHPELPLFTRTKVIVGGGLREVRSEPLCSQACKSVSCRKKKEVSEPSIHSSKTPDKQALVINCSHQVAKHITDQLQNNMPDFSILYAPGVEMAKWILKRRAIDLVVSSLTLPDGSVSDLRSALEGMANPPDVVVVDPDGHKGTEIFESDEYEFKSLRHFLSSANQGEKSDQVSILGADLRNDLNNPLQEIVAMVFVAKSNGEAGEAVDQALSAIEGAAKNMADVVSGLEDRMRELEE